MSQTVISVLIGLISMLLPKLGLNLGNDAITTTVTTLVTIASFLWIYIRRVQVGDITVGGIRKK